VVARSKFGLRLAAGSLRDPAGSGRDSVGVESAGSPAFGIGVMGSGMALEGRGNRKKEKEN